MDEPRGHCASWNKSSQKEEHKEWHQRYTKPIIQPCWINNCEQLPIGSSPEQLKQPYTMLLGSRDVKQGRVHPKMSHLISLPSLWLDHKGKTKSVQHCVFQTPLSFFCPQIFLWRNLRNYSLNHVIKSKFWIQRKNIQNTSAI